MARVVELAAGAAGDEGTVLLAPQRHPSISSLVTRIAGSASPKRCGTGSSEVDGADPLEDLVESAHEARRVTPVPFAPAVGGVIVGRGRIALMVAHMSL